MIRSRILKGLGASAYSRLVVLASQVLLVPLFITSWGSSTYGEWLSLTALASFISYSSLGLAQALRSEVALTLAREGRAAAAGLFHTGIALILGLSAVGVATFWIFIASVDVSHLLNLKALAGGPALSILWLLVTQIVLNLVAGIVAANLSATGHYGLAQFLDANRQLADFLATLIVVGLLHGSPVAAARIFPITAGLSLIAGVGVLAARAPWLFGGTRLVGLSHVRRLWRPTLGAFLLTFGYTGLVVQAPRLIVARTMGPAAVAVFALASMLLRLVRIPIEIPSFSATVEMAAASGQGDKALMQQLLATISRFSVWIGLVLVPLTVLVGPALVHVWSNGRLEVPYDLVIVLGLSTLAFAVGLPGQEGLMAINRLLGASSWLIVLSAPFAVVCYLLSLQFGLLGAGLSVLIFETVFAAIANGRCLKLFDYPPQQYLRAVARPPLDIISGELRRMRQPRAPLPSSRAVDLGEDV